MTTIAEGIKGAFPTLNTAEQFAEARVVARAKLAELKQELSGIGVVENGRVTTGTKPFLIFSRLAAGVMEQPEMKDANALLNEKGRQDGLGAQFLIACNRPEADETYADPACAGKSSMSARHKFITTKDLDW